MKEQKTKQPRQVLPVRPRLKFMRPVFTREPARLSSDYSRRSTPAADLDEE